MKNKILIFGAGGLCKQILNNHNIKNNYIIYQDNPIFDKFFENFKTTNKISNDFTHFILAISGTKIRKRITNLLYKYNLKPINFINSKINKDTLVENNVVILQDVFIEPCVEICEGSLLNVGSKIFHDVKIGKFCEIAPQSCILGGAEIGDYTFIGAGSIILPKIKIGKNCIIGAGSIVTKNIPNNQVWFGNPAKFKYNKNN
jgi:sugar O-acyltransferase (sialic acid O-acetyltransferase NeuD family)